MTIQPESDKQTRVLIVEDEPDLQEAMVSYLNMDWWPMVWAACRLRHDG